LCMVPISASTNFLGDFVLFLAIGDNHF